jgi:hypothetical protein
MVGNKGPYQNSGEVDYEVAQARFHFKYMEESGLYEKMTGVNKPGLWADKNLTPPWEWR